MPQRLFRQFTWAAEKLCESPIERRMLSGLMLCPFGYYDDPNQILDPAEMAQKGGISFNGDGAVIVPQATIPRLPYRVDFLVALNPRHVEVSPIPCFVIECDGHDFHERTKQQAARDRKKDRDIQNIGIPCLRFTGSEIYKDLDECVNQVDAFGANMLEKLWGL